jgi:hypothetical protein
VFPDGSSKNVWNRAPSPAGEGLGEVLLILSQPGFPKTKNHEMKDLFRKPRCEKNLAIFNPKNPILIDLSEFYFPKKK